MPDDVPRARVYEANNTLVGQYDLPILDQYTQVGLFLFPLFLGNGYATGNYNVLYTYDVASFSGLEVGTFDIVAGGHVDGHILAATFYKKPHADFIVYQTETGKIKSGRNPTV